VRVVGIALGSRRIGVAVSDPGGILASPVEVITRAGDEAREHRRILEIAAEYEAGGIVVGLPLSLDGSLGPAAVAALAETERLRATTDLPVDTYDERFTTVTADRHLMERRMKADARRRIIDKAAAAVMLQAWLDGQRLSDKHLSDKPPSSPEPS
jgi:putative Holliday junction resolvase